MTNRIQDILAYIDKEEQQASPQAPDGDGDGGISPPVETPRTLSDSRHEVPQQASLGDLSIFNDDKMYNKFSRQLKKNKYPMIFEGTVLNSEAEAQMLKQQILASRRDYKRTQKQKTIKESKMNFEAMPTLNDDDFEDLYEEDGYIYKKSKYPYAVNKDGKKKLIPKTSVKDTKKIYKAIESTSGKEGIKHLVKASSGEEFKSRTDEVINKVNDEDIRNSYYNHTNNDFADDKTWNQGSFLRLMFNMMKENEELKSKALRAADEVHAKKYQHQQQSSFRINPALMKKN